MLLVVTVVFLCFYALLIFFYFYHWLRTKEFTPKTESSTFISVVIAARNEEDNIASLLEALLNQSYSHEFFEVIVVDDFSTDKTVEKVKPFLSNRIQLVQPEVNIAESS